MVNNEASLNSLFGALADPTRRNILGRLAAADLSVGQIARQYSMSVPAISKHLKVLESAGFITKRKEGKERIASIRPEALKEIDMFLSHYEALYTEKLDRLDEILKEE